MPSACRFGRLAALAAALGLVPPTAQAQPLADFYRGKTVSIVVSTGPGGGYDVMARAIARFIGKHLPGNPTVLVRNMPGAGGITAMNYLYNAAEKDGTVIGAVQNGTPFEPLFGTKEARYDAPKFNWLGTPSFEVAMVLLWHRVPVNSIDELRTRETNVGASGAHSTPAFYGRVLNATLGTKMKLVSGYPGMTDGLLAMERGELDGYPSAFYSALTSTRPNWLRDKLAKLQQMLRDNQMPPSNVQDRVRTLDHELERLAEQDFPQIEQKLAEAKRAERHHNDDLQQQLAHDQRPQSSSASRPTAGAFGFFTFTQQSTRPQQAPV